MCKKNRFIFSEIAPAVPSLFILRPRVHLAGMKRDNTALFISGYEERDGEIVC
jgi:hypothetical protein